MMVSIIAPPEIFSAYAFAEDDSDPDLRWGAHLRIYAGLGPSFPLTPFLVVRLNSSESEPRGVHVTDRNGHSVPGPDLGAHGIVDATLLLGDSDTRRTVRVDLDENSASIDGAALLDQKGRVIAVRNRPSWLFSAPMLYKLRVWGSAGDVFFRTRAVNVTDILETGRVDPVATPGLPVDGSYPWYVGFQDRDDAMRRVEDGAPKRLNPMDRPFGPFDVVEHADEVNRIEAMLNAMQFGDGLENLILRLVGDDQTVPWRQRDLTELPVRTGARQFANAYRLGTMQMAAVDPGLARFLGFSERIDDLPDLSGRGWDTLAVLGLFAIAPREFVRYGVDVVSLLYGPAPGADTLLDRLIQGLETFSGNSLRDPIDEMINRIREQGFAVAPFVTFAAPVPAWLPPELPKPEVTQTRWQGTRGDAPSMLFRSSFAFPQMPLASLSALARVEDGDWVSRHEMLQVSPFQPTERAKPGIFGHELEPNARLNELNPKVKVQETAGLISDQDIPADAGEVTFSVRASDCFGRFGTEMVFGVEPPKRPKPPLPILRFHIERATIDLTSDADLSPGVLKLTVAVPEAWPEERFTTDQEKLLGAAIVVPRLDDLAPGALALGTLELGLGAPAIPVDLTTPGFFPVDIPLPVLGPQKSKTFTLTSRFVDMDGNESDIASVPITVTDVRPPVTYPTGIGLYWTSAPGPAPTVELKLRWTAAAKSRHRVYLTDQAGLALTDAELEALSPTAEPSRGLVAAVGCNKVIGGAAGRKEAFRLLTDPPIEANDAGEVIFPTSLPRSLATVQFLRVVPLGPDGAEPPFDACGIVPVAVPESRRPPAPRIEGEVDASTGHATLTVSTDGFDRVALERDEPGLFQPGQPGTEPPQAFIRRAVGAVADPIYARSLGSGALSLVDATAGNFSATISDTNGGSGLEPFVRYVYWAEVRLPPERRLPANFVPLDPAGGIGPVDPSARQSHPRPMSLPSAPRVLMHAPPSPPAAPEAGNVAVSRSPAAAGTVAVTINVTDPPSAHQKAVDQFRLAVWTQWPGGTIEPIANANGQSLSGTWPVMPSGVVTTNVAVPPGADATAALTLRLAFVDPIGRMGEILTITAL